MTNKELEKKLKRIMKRQGEIPDEVMEKLEDKYHVDLTHEYGESDLSVIKRIMRKLK